MKPQIVRADTIDLQDQRAPSAQDHSNHTHPNPLGVGHPAPHQDAAIKSMEQERHAEQEYVPDAWGSGRSSHEGSELLDEDMNFMTDTNATTHETSVDNLAMQQNGGESQDDPETNESEGEGDDDDMTDKISSSPSIEDEDIDFELVYALHTFVATVDGQANATKGDSMVLLDDSNSYWWLVRIVKDTTIGYLPAEHIETPTERLARLNKHRNIDLATTMLSDNQEKPKNPLKKAMRRRNAKVVQFGPPTYYEPSGIEWSDEEEQEGEQDDQTEGQKAQDTKQEENAAVAVAEVEQNKAQNSAQSTGQTRDLNTNITQNTSTEQTDAETRASTETSPQSENGSEHEGTSSTRSRNGTMRNTDSFFKDDKSPPMKMSLTPNLLREESSNSSPRTSESTEKSIPEEDIFEKIDKNSITTQDLRSDKSKDKEDKKRKEKKAGMLSGLFKRKEKKIKVDEAHGGTVRQSVDGDILGTASPISVDSGETSPVGDRSPTSQKQGPKPGKLVKAPPSSLSTNTFIEAPPSRTIGFRDSKFYNPTEEEDMGHRSSKEVRAHPRISAPIPDSATWNGESIDPRLVPGAYLTPAKDLKQKKKSSKKKDAKKDAKKVQPTGPFIIPSTNEQAKKAPLRRARDGSALVADSSPDRSFNPFHPTPLRIPEQASNQRFEADEQISPVEAAGRTESSGHASGEPTDTISPLSSPMLTDSSGFSVESPATPPEMIERAPNREAPRPLGMTFPDDFNMGRALEYIGTPRAHQDACDHYLRVMDTTGVVPHPYDHPSMGDLDKIAKDGMRNALASLDALFKPLHQQMEANGVFESDRRLASRRAGH